MIHCVLPMKYRNCSFRNRWTFSFFSSKSHTGFSGVATPAHRHTNIPWSLKIGENKTLRKNLHYHFASFITVLVLSSVLDSWILSFSLPKKAFSFMLTTKDNDKQDSFANCAKKQGGSAIYVVPILTNRSSSGTSTEQNTKTKVLITALLSPDHFFTPSVFARNMGRDD